MRTLTLASSIGQLVLMLVVCGYTVYFVKEVTFRIKAQVEYETEFLDRHEIIINELQHLPLETNEYMPLTFQNLEIDHLFSLCKQYRCTAWSLQQYLLGRRDPRLVYNQPEIEVNFLRLRRVAVAVKLFKVQVIRCNDMHALIEAGDDLFAYVLEKDGLNIETGIPVFTMYSKFKYKWKRD